MGLPPFFGVPIVELSFFCFSEDGSIFDPNGLIFIPLDQDLNNFIIIIFFIIMQPNQINMAVFFRYFVQNDASVCYCTYTVQVTFYKVPEKLGHV